MKRIFPLLLLVTLLCVLFAGCSQANTPSPDKPTPSESGAESGEPGSTLQNTSEDTMYILIGEHILPVKTADNSSAEALLALLQDGNITVDAHDYGNFEKVGALGVNLPTNDERITTQPGDVILYQGNQITVYYDTNSWNFTRLGKVQGVTDDELKAILGDGDVTMVLSLDDPNRTPSAGH